MKPKHFYLAMCVVGTIIPYAIMAKFFLEMGTDYHLMADWLFVNIWNTFFLADLLLVAIVIICYIFIEGRKIKMPQLWIPLICVSLVGVCLALPLFLYMRELHLEKIDVAING